MGTVERRERGRQEVRTKILEAARELLIKEGYERMTMRRIAEAIEYTPTTIYNHFKDKDEVVLTLCQEDFASLLATLREVPPSDDPLNGMRALGLSYARFALNYPNHYRFMLMTPAKPDHVLTEADAGWQAFALVRSAVAVAAERGLLRPGSLDTFAQVLWSSMHGVVALLITHRPDQFPMLPPADDLVEQVIETSLRGLLANPKPLTTELQS